MVVFTILVIIASILGVAILLDILMRLNPKYQQAKNIVGLPIPSIWIIIKFICTLTPASTFDLPRNWAKEFKQTYRTFSLAYMNLEICRAREMEIILSSSKHNFKGNVYDLARPFLGEGLLISKGSKWLQRRRILTPAFHFSILQQFYSVFREESKELIKTLHQESEHEDGTPLAPLTSRFTLNTICETSMGVKLDKLKGAETYRSNIYDLGEILLERFLRPWLHVKEIYNLSLNKVKADKLLHPIHSFTRDIIQLRRNIRNEDNQKQSDDEEDNIYESKKRRYAMLDTLLAAEAKGEIDAEGIREEVDTFTFEGHDTTSSGLIFIFLMLALHQDVQQRVYEEIKELAENLPEGETLSMADFNKLEYTDRVVKECLRIFPPVPFISRNLTEDITLLTGDVIPAGTVCHLHIYDLHRDPEQFPDPDRFDPDRFLPEVSSQRHPFAYLPFSAGPRNCIGQKFALLEMKTVMENVLMNFKINPFTKLEDIVFIADIVLRTKDPVKVKFVPRNKA